jgi:hypothetical protein
MAKFILNETLLKMIIHSRLKERLLMAIIFICLTGCKKNEKPVVFPVALYAERIEIASSTRLYTKDGEIKDPQKVAMFVKDLVVFRWENDDTNKGQLAITFPSKEKAIFGEQTYQFDVAQTCDQFLFTSEIQYSTVPANRDDYRTHILKYKNVVTLPFANDQVREVRVGYGNYTQLRIPMMAYATHIGDNSSSSKSTGISNNEFDLAALSYLKANDTLAVKVYNVICKAKQ